MPRRVAFNGKFLSARPTGVHRVARELILNCDDILAQRSPDAVANEWRVVKPADATADLPLQAMSIQTLRPLTWQFWEQFTLPALTGNDILINLCNLAPIFRDGITLIHDAQVFISPTSYSFAFRNWYQSALPLIGKNSTSIATVSQYSKDMLVKYGIADAEKISVIHNGADHILRSPPDIGIIDRLELTNTPFVCALSNTQHHKNIPVLLKAFAQPELKHVKLVLIGGATAADFAQKQLEIPDNVIFSGTISDGQMRALFEAAVCFAFPSLTEGFGLPPLEAMRLGCLAVVAPCGSLPEVCGDAAFYADPDAPDDWTRAIGALIEPSDALTARRGRSIAHAQTFTWRESATKLMSLIEAMR